MSLFRNIIYTFNGTPRLRPSASRMYVDVKYYTLGQWKVIRVKNIIEIKRYTHSDDEVRAELRFVIDFTLGVQGAKTAARGFRVENGGDPAALIYIISPVGRDEKKKKQQQ